MNSAQLVNLLLDKLRRVEFLSVCTINNSAKVRFVWGHNKYLAVPSSDGFVHIYPARNHMEIYTERLEGMLNGLVRNDAGEMVQP